MLCRMIITCLLLTLVKSAVNAKHETNLKNYLLTDRLKTFLKSLFSINYNEDVKPSQLMINKKVHSPLKELASQKNLLGQKEREFYLPIEQINGLEDSSRKLDRNKNTFKIKYYSDAEPSRDYTKIIYTKIKRPRESYSTIVTADNRLSGLAFANPPSRVQFPDLRLDRNSSANYLQYPNAADRTRGPKTNIFTKFVSEFDEKGYPLDPSLENFKWNNGTGDSTHSRSPDANAELTSFKSRLPILPNDNNSRYPKMKPVSIHLPHIRQPYTTKDVRPTAPVPSYKKVKVPFNQIINTVAREAPYQTENVDPINLQEKMPVFISKPFPMIIFLDTKHPGTNGKGPSSQNLYHAAHNDYSNYYYKEKPWKLRAHVTYL